MTKILLMTMVVAVLFGTTLALDLTGDWKSATGEHIFIRQINNTFWYYGESSAANPAWTSVGYGTLDGNTVNITWTDVPKGNASLKGTVTLNVNSDKELEVTNQTGGWGTKGYTLTKVRSGF